MPTPDDNSDMWLREKKANSFTVNIFCQTVVHKFKNVKLKY